MKRIAMPESKNTVTIAQSGQPSETMTLSGGGEGGFMFLISSI